MLNWWVNHNYLTCKYCVACFLASYVWIFGFDGIRNYILCPVSITTSACWELILISDVFIFQQL
mgnify:CR=1 FL=1|jgi:hypothetical protein